MALATSLSTRKMVLSVAIVPGCVPVKRAPGGVDARSQVTVNFPMRLGLTTFCPNRHVQRRAMPSLVKNACSD